MSYARLSSSSDVYVYDCDEGWTCCWCRLFNDARRWSCATRGEMIRHLYEHRAHGHKVEDSTLADLEAEEVAGLPNGEYLFT